MNIRHTAALAAVLAAMGGATAAAAKIVDFTAYVDAASYSTDPSLVGAPFSVTWSYDTDSLPTYSSGTQNVYGGNVDPDFFTSPLTIKGTFGTYAYVYDAYLNISDNGDGSVSYTLNASTDGGLYGEIHFDLPKDGHVEAGAGPPDSIDDYLPSSLGYYSGGVNTKFYFRTGQYAQTEIGGNVVATSSQSQSAAPEPASWALMMSGVAVAGAALRARRRLAAAVA